MLQFLPIVPLLLEDISLLAFCISPFRYPLHDLMVITNAFSLSRTTSSIFTSAPKHTNTSRSCFFLQLLLLIGAAEVPDCFEIHYYIPSLSPNASVKCWRVLESNIVNLTVNRFPRFFNCGIFSDGIIAFDVIGVFYSYHGTVPCKILHNY